MSNHVPRKVVWRRSSPEKLAEQILADDLRRKKYIIWFNAWILGRNKEANAQVIPYPEECRGLTCGAKTRRGTRCKRIDINRGARCKYHGGYSTGPNTVEGKKRSAMNAKKRTP